MCEVEGIVVFGWGVGFFVIDVEEFVQDVCQYFQFVLVIYYWEMVMMMVVEDWEGYVQKWGFCVVFQIFVVGIVDQKIDWFGEEQ